MAELDTSVADVPVTAPPPKRRKVHQEDSTESTPRYDTPDAKEGQDGKDKDDKSTLRVSIREQQRESPSASRSPSPKRRDNYYSSDHDTSRISRSITRSPVSGDPTPFRTPAADAGVDVASEPPQPRQPTKPNFKPRLILGGHRKPISQVRISPDGRWIASASADGTIKIWEASTGRHIETLVGHMAGVSAVAWSPDSKTLASGSDDKAIRFWDRVTGQPARSRPLLGHHNYVYCLAFSPKGNILASGSYDEAVFLWDVRAGRLMRSLPAHSDPVSGIDFSRDGTLVVSCSTDGLTRIWDTSTGQCLRTMVHEDNPPVTSVCFAPNGRYLLAFSMDSCIRLWDYVSGQVKKTYQGHTNAGFSIGGCFSVVDGKAYVTAASEDGDIVLWDIKTKEIVQRIEKAHDGVCFWVDLHGDTMVSCGQDGKIKVFRHRGPVEECSMAAEAATSEVPNGTGDSTDRAAPEAMDVDQDQSRSISPLKTDAEIKNEES
ncbi:hypothetical protein PG994_011479 [Apiospora phragmitis]|uniref:WDR5-like beta-propeller domain-containing protein n=1 Tax=Apiospora phragmitis TaxID=2905665 RepID=A0ABR1TT02_9PEZI